MADQRLRDPANNGEITHAELRPLGAPREQGKEDPQPGSVRQKREEVHRARNELGWRQDVARRLHGLEVHHVYQAAIIGLTGFIARCLQRSAGWGIL